MKRPALVITLIVLGLAAAGYGLTPVVRLHLEQKRRQDAEALYEKTAPRLVLDAKTQAILSGAERVETFRLADFHEEMRNTEEETLTEQAILSGPHAQSLDNYGVLRVGQPQGRAFADGLSAALAQAKITSIVSCFDPGVGFRVWKGQAHVDLCLCFYCAGVEITAKDAHHRTIQHEMTSLGASRPAFLALSKQAFPQDKQLAALK